MIHHDKVEVIQAMYGLCTKLNQCNLCQGKNKGQSISKVAEKAVDKTQLSN
jgi:hypothetical protein